MQSWIWRGILLYENEQFKVRQPDSQAPLIGGTLSESVFGHTQTSLNRASKLAKLSFSKIALNKFKKFCLNLLGTYMESLFREESLHSNCLKSRFICTFLFLKIVFSFCSLQLLNFQCKNSSSFLISSKCFGRSTLFSLVGPTKSG